MASFRLDMRALANEIRGDVPGALDMRPHTVEVLVRTWTGERAGLGTKTDVITFVKNHGYNPRVKALGTKDVDASGGLYQSGEFEIGPITPEYVSAGLTGGTDGEVLDPATTTTAREVFYRLTGPGLPTGGAWFARVSDDNLKAFRNTVVVRRTAEPVL